MSIYFIFLVFILNFILVVYKLTAITISVHYYDIIPKIYNTIILIFMDADQKLDFI